MFGLTILFGEKITAYYRVDFSIFGKIAKAKATFLKKDGKYELCVEGEATGIAKTLSRNRKEIYKSIGIIKEGILIPQKFIKIRFQKNKKDIKTYYFNHKKRVVTKETIKIRNKKILLSEKKKIPFYASNDILTLYFNAKFYKKREFCAVGGNRKNGKVSIEVLKKYEKNTKYIKISFYQRVFASKKGEVFLVVRKDKIALKGILKDVLFFGDIKASLVKTKTE